jgi:tRNA-(ms[2]io[6]A)-hydroxylase
MDQVDDMFMFFFLVSKFLPCQNLLFLYKTNHHMLGLKLPTDPRWVNIVEKKIEDILTDHAWCEQKAATNAINLVTNNPHLSDLVRDMLNIAKEEVDHFNQVHELIVARGFTMGMPGRDEYVRDLYDFMIKGGNRNQSLVERLLFSALIEARSCERFRVLSLNIQDEELARFYHELMVSEAGHYTTFLSYARKYANGIDVEARWKEWLDYEAEIIQNYGKRESIHG